MRQRFEEKLQGVQNFCETAGIVGKLRTKLLDNVRTKYPGQWHLTTCAQSYGKLFPILRKNVTDIFRV
eukprot:COSAG05_NODE_898_length_6685_cov_4.419223_4_plen_68_part_00